MTYSYANWQHMYNIIIYTHTMIRFIIIMYIIMCIYIYIHSSIYTHIHSSLYIYIYEFVQYIYIFIHTYIYIYILERLVAAQPEIAWSPQTPKEWSLINRWKWCSCIPDPTNQIVPPGHRSVAPFPIWRSRQRSLPPQARLEPLPFAAEAQGCRNMWSWTGSGFCWFSDTQNCKMFKIHRWAHLHVVNGSLPQADSLSGRLGFSSFRIIPFRSIGHVTEPLQTGTGVRSGTENFILIM